MTGKFEIGFGPHLLVEGWRCPYHVLNSREVLHNFLDELPDLIGMTKISPPNGFRYNSHCADELGLSGFILIAESHISVHTYPNKGSVAIDIFSCKQFDVDATVRFCEQSFRIGQVRSRLADRGLEFPRDTGAVTEFLRKERGR